MQADLFTQTTGAEFSPCRRWRYTLWRIWDSECPYCAFIGLNPSTATETENDPTVSRCINYARDWGYGGMYMLNLFAWRATDPDDMKAADEPVGEDNDAAILRIANAAGLVICAWGNHGAYRERSTGVKELLRAANIQVHCLTVTGTGEPGHPLYLRANCKPVPFDLTNPHNKGGVHGKF